MIEFWNELVNTGLLGTDKKEIVLHHLPAGIQSALQKEKTSSKELLLLKAAALSSNYLKAGVSAEKLTLPAIPASEPEQQPYVNSAAMIVLKKLLDEEDKNPFLIEYWLINCREKNWIVRANTLVNLLNLGADKRYQFLQQPIQSVVGKRGEWLAQFNPAWQYVLIPDVEKIWQEGKSTERQEVLRNIRMKEPMRARELLQTTWNQESAKDKSVFLGILQVNLSAEDEPFLQAVWEEVWQSKDRSKPASQEVNTAAVRLLLSLPESVLSRQIRQKIQPYFQKKKKGFLQKAEIQLSLPKTEDEFFSVEWMHHRLGFEKLSPEPENYSEAAYWLNELLKYIPPSFWKAHFDLEVVDAIRVFDEHESFTRKTKGKQRSLFVSAVGEAAYRHGDVDWTRAYLRRFKNPEDFYRCSLLPTSELEEFLMEHADAGMLNKNRDTLLDRRRSSWSLDFTRYVMQMLCKSVEKYYYSKENQQFIKQMILFLDPAIVSELDGLTKDKSQEWLRQQWRESVVVPVIRMLEIRREIGEAFAIISEQ